MSKSRTRSASALRASISPPPTKKRRISAVADGAPSSEEVPPSSLLTAPHEHWLRIYSWNVNGIDPFIQPSISSYLQTSPAPIFEKDAPIPTSLRNFLRRHHWPQILQLQEVKINPSDLSTQRAVERVVNVCRTGPDDGPRYIVKFCLPRDKYNATGFKRKVYGVATIIRLDFYQEDVETVREVDWDLEGRCLVVETKAKLSIWNIYAVNGTTSAYRNSQTGEEIGARHDRKLAFHRHMLEECQALEKKGYRVVLAGDMNIARERIDGFPKLRTRPEQHCKNREDFNKKFFDDKDGLRAVDSFRHLHPTIKKYTWVSRTREFATCCDRVDLIILSRGLVEGMQRGLVEADILMTEIERGPSDHCPLFVSLDVAQNSSNDSSQTEEMR